MCSSGAETIHLQRYHQPGVSTIPVQFHSRRLRKTSTGIIHIKGVPNDARPYSPMLVVSGAGITPRTWDLDDLKAMPQVNFDASTSTVNTKGNWFGPTLKSVLEASGVDTSDTNGYIIVLCADGYATLLSMYEATHQEGDQQVLLAISDTLGNSLNNGLAKDEGLTRLVVPKDALAGRWGSNVAQIIVCPLS